MRLKNNHIVTLILLLLCFIQPALLRSQVNTFGHTIPQDGLIAYYPNSTEKSILYDSSNNGIHGLRYNTSAETDRNNTTYSCGFSGSTNSYAEIEADSFLRDEYTYSLWFYLDNALSNNSLQVLLEIGNNTSSSGQSVVIANNYMSNIDGVAILGSNNSGTALFACQSKTTVPTQKWVNVVAVRNQNSLSLYINGELIDKQSSGTNNTPKYPSSPGVFLGMSAKSFFPFEGRVDDIAFWSRPLSECEIKQVYGNYYLNFDQGGVSPASLHRACLDRVTGELSLSITPSNDTFSRFHHYGLWGRDNIYGSFELLVEENDINYLILKTVLPNKKRWELYLSSYSGCAGQDSILSNIIYIDDKAPDYVEPDSVSVDPVTQKIIAGWSKPSDTDIMGYSVFKVDNQGNNLLVDEPNALRYVFDINTFNPNQQGNKLAIAGFDSCRNGGVISNFHSPIFLQGWFSPKYQCDKLLNLKWDEYIGWATSGHRVIIKDTNSNQILFDSLFSNGDNTYTFTLPYLDLDLMVVVKAVKLLGGASTTSNILTFSFSEIKPPATTTDLYFTSVENNNEISLSANVNMGDSFTLLYQPQSTGNQWVEGFSGLINSTVFNWTLNPANTNNEVYLIKLLRYNVCNEVADSSVIAGTVLLSRSNQTLNWNPPNHFTLNGWTTDYVIEKFETGVWAPIANTNTTVFIPQGFGIQRFRVRSTTPDLVPNNKNWSLSNEIEIDLGFDSSQLDSFFIPNAFSPDGANPVFRVVNSALGFGEARLFIYNRWGEIIWDGDALVGWDGRINGSPVMDGMYIYMVEAHYRNKRKTLSGTVLLLK